MKTTGIKVRYVSLFSKLDNSCLEQEEQEDLTKPTLFCISSPYVHSDCENPKAHFIIVCYILFNKTHYLFHIFQSTQVSSMMMQPDYQFDWLRVSWLTKEHSWLSPWIVNAQELNLVPGHCPPPLLHTLQLATMNGTVSTSEPFHHYVSALKPAKHGLKLLKV